MKTLQDRINALEAKKEALVSQAEEVLKNRIVRMEGIAGQAQQCVDLYNSGLTLEEVGAKVGISAPLVAQRMDLLGAARRPAGDKQRTSPHLDEIIKLREEGKTYQAIGDIFGVTRERIRQVLKRERPDLCYRQVKTENRTCPSCGKTYLSAPSHQAKCCSIECAGKLRRKNHLEAHKEQIELAVILKSNGATWGEIGHHFNVSAMTVLRWVEHAMKAGLIDIPDRNKIFPHGGGLHD